MKKEFETPERSRLTIPAVTLHIGTMKTGSTAIQNGFEKNHDFLLTHRVLFPRSILSRTHPNYPRRTSGHLRFLKRWREEDSQALAAELQAAFGAADSLFLSAENIFHEFDGSSLDALGSFLGDADVTLLCFLRPQLEWSASLYHEFVTRGRRRETLGFPDFVETLLAEGKLDYHSRLKAISGIVGASRVIAVNYEEAKERGGAVDAALNALGIGTRLPEPVTQDDGNPSLSFPEAIEAHRRLNTLAGTLSDIDYFSWCAGMEEAAAALRLERGIPVAHVEAEPALRQRVLDACEAPNRKLSAEFLGGAPFGATSRGKAIEGPAPLDKAVVGELMLSGMGLLAPYLAEGGAKWRESRRALEKAERRSAGKDRRIAELTAKAEALRTSLRRARHHRLKTAAKHKLREKEIRARQVKLEMQARQLAMLRVSTSWRLTAPLRVVRKSGAAVGRRLKKLLLGAGRT